MTLKLDVGAEVARLTAKREMYSSIIQEMYDVLQHMHNPTSKIQLLQNLYILENPHAREQCLKLCDEIN